MSGGELRRCAAGGEGCTDRGKRARDREEAEPRPRQRSCSPISSLGADERTLMADSKQGFAGSAFLRRPDFSHTDGAEMICMNGARVGVTGFLSMSRTVGGQSPRTGRAEKRTRREEEEEEGDESSMPCQQSEVPHQQSSGSGSSASSSPPSSVGGELARPSESNNSLSVYEPIGFGHISVAGRQREMEDAVSVQPAFFHLDGSPLHFFAVFDGHGGPHVSALCKERMHTILVEELASMNSSSSSSQMADTRGKREDEEFEFARWKTAVARCFARMDAIALTACACGRVGEPLCTCELAGIKSSIVGSTAVVALITNDRILIANCGDSRAVFSRAGRAFPLSSDHKPDRPDELARIEATGGRVIYVNGARVRGILAMSRALGDRYLKPEVISEPEFSTVKRTNEDEFLILASDGLWDVLSNDLACDVARRCLSEADPHVRGAVNHISSGSDEPSSSRQVEGEGQNRPEPRCQLAAALLARLALGRGSEDNISSIVVDLRKRS